MPSVTRVTGALLLAGLTAVGASGADKGKQAPGKPAAPPATTSATPPAQGAQPNGNGRGNDVGGVRAWWKDRDMVKEVGLMAAQVTKIDGIYEKRRAQIQPKVDAYNKQKAELDRMLLERTAKPEEIEEQAKRLMFPRFDIDVSRTRMLYEISLVMTADQNNKLRAIFDRMDQERRAAMEKLEQERAKGRRGGNHQSR